MTAKAQDAQAQAQTSTDRIEKRFVLRAAQSRVWRAPSRQRKSLAHGSG